MARNSVGLDIGTRAVRLAEIHVNGGKPSLTRFGRMLLPVGAVDHGEVTDPDAVASTITALWKRLGLSGRSVHVGLANRRVVVRVIELPAMEKQDLEGAIRYQAQEHIPIPLDEAVMDFEVVEEIEGPDGERFQRVLVVAAERGTVTSLLAALKAANLDPGTLELNAYPLVRCFGNRTGAAEAIVDVGAGVTNVVVHRDGKIRFTRILPTFGGDEFTSAVEQRLSVHRDEAEILKRRVASLLNERSPQRIAVGGGGSRGFEPAQERERGSDEDGAADADVVREARSTGGSSRRSPRQSSAPSGSVGAPSAQLEEVASTIEPLLDRFVTEVRGSLDFYSSQPNAPAIERVVLTGGGSLVGGMVERLAEAMGIAVDRGHPFERVPIGNVDVSPEERAVAEPFIGVAVGLALAGVEK